MAYGKNIWRSRAFEMRVDIKGTGLDYDLLEHDEDFKGTRVDVDLYDPILPSDLERTFTEIRSYVAWAQVPVFLNGEQISQQPDGGKWTHEDENAFYALSPDRQQLSIYNLGVLVGHNYAGRYGMGGTVVSKKQLEVNFARNDVQSTCPVGKEINALIKREATKGVEKKTRMTDAERDMLVRDFLAGDAVPADALKLRILTDVFGRSWPISKLTQIKEAFGNRLVVAERGDLLIETSQRRGYVFSIDQATLERFGASDATSFKKRLASVARKMTAVDSFFTSPYDQADTRSKHLFNIIAENLEEVEVVDRLDLNEFVSSDHIPIESTEMTADQKVLLSSIKSGYAKMIVVLNSARYEDQRYSQRKICLGRSDSALGWTDGTSTIWIDVDYARLLRRGYAGAAQISMLLLHETLHEGPDTGTHQHDHAFYQAYHDISGLPQDPVGFATEHMVNSFIAKLRQYKKRVSKALLQNDDADLMIDALRQEINAKDETTT
jgi:hypothetical protein